MSSDGRTFASLLNWMTHHQPPSTAALFFSVSDIRASTPAFVCRLSWIQVTCRRRSSGECGGQLGISGYNDGGIKREIFTRSVCKCVFPSAAWLDEGLLPPLTSTLRTSSSCQVCQNCSRDNFNKFTCFYDVAFYCDISVLRSSRGDGNAANDCSC